MKKIAIVMFVVSAALAGCGKKKPAAAPADTSGSAAAPATDGSAAPAADGSAAAPAADGAGGGM